MLDVKLLQINGYIFNVKFERRPNRYIYTLLRKAHDRENLTNEEKQFLGIDSTEETYIGRVSADPENQTVALSLFHPLKNAKITSNINEVI